MLITSNANMSDANVLARISTLFGVDDAGASAMAECITSARAADQVLAVVKGIATGFDFGNTDSDADDLDYKDTIYTLDDERLVLVTYEKLDGSLVKFVLNYNIFSVSVKLDGVVYVIEPYDYCVVRNTTGGEG